MSVNQAQLTQRKRTFLPNDLEINQWSDLEPYFKTLEDREVSSPDEFRQWLRDLSELEAVVEENAGWRYIRMSIDTRDEKLAESYRVFVAEIQPKISPYSDRLNRKLLDLEQQYPLSGSEYKTLMREISKDVELFREKNIELKSEIQQKSQEFGNISGAQTIELEGKEITMQQAAKYYKSTDRKVRKAVFEKVSKRRLEDRSRLDALFNELIGLRHIVAVNAGFENYRDYKFRELGRFDYKVADCMDFHLSIEEEVMPLMKQFQQERKAKLGCDLLRPYDLQVDPEGRDPLEPFEDGKALLDGSVEIFSRIRPKYGEYLRTMDEIGHLDLESKPGKSPGGYNYPLFEIGVPFIFMNAVGSQRDLVTMLHEGGHALHSFLSRDLELTAFKSFPSEVAELASMSMELISMDHWDVFYKDAEELYRAKEEQLKGVIAVLPWIATIDKFQHWIYTHPKHNLAEREAAWLDILKQFGTGMLDWTGYEESKAAMWQKQLHLFEVPFYYIEYGMAQLGAIAVWRNYRKDPEKALDQYEDALKLGYTKTLPEIYETAGIQFDFSREYVKELIDFVQGEMKALK